MVPSNNRDKQRQAQQGQRPTIFKGFKKLFWVVVGVIGLLGIAYQLLANPFEFIAIVLAGAAIVAWPSHY